MVPRIGPEKQAVTGLKEGLEFRIRDMAKKVFDRYCPDQCLLEALVIEGAQITRDAARGMPSNRLVTHPQSDMVFRIDNIQTEITMDEALSEENRQRIATIFEARTKFASPMNINVRVTPFPESFSEKQKRLAAEKNDPYGLGKLREMLTIFRDLAGTKEIITNTSSERLSEQNSSSTSATESSNSSESVSSATNESSMRRSDINSSTSEESMSMEEVAVYVAGLILLLTLMLLAVIKFSKANRSANEMISSNQSGQAGLGGPAILQAGSGFQGGDSRSSEGADTSVKSEDAQLVLKIRVLKEELIKMFMEQPKVAKETFSRMIREDGVEFTAKYVNIFGQVVIFELLSDPTLQRDLYELSEFYHRSSFDFSLEEQLELLEKLKTRVTASEIRVLTRKSSEKFDFLTKLDSEQIFNLISEEKVQIQSIVLTQLGRKKRASVFEMYQGEAKVQLLSELSTAEAIPKDYLLNVAQALHKKVKTRPEFDTENLRSSDILLDLLEKATLGEQKKLMVTLSNNNPEIARGLKMKLVTVEILPYLKDGHLLEIVLGMEREPLLLFLAGCPEHVRDLLLHKAPEELADSWIEDLDTMGSVDDTNYRMAEMKIISRIRGLANNGVISLLEINEMVFQSPENDAGVSSNEAIIQNMSGGAVAA